MLTFQDFVEIHKNAIKYLASIPDKLELAKSVSKDEIQEIIKGKGITRTDALELLKKFHIQYRNSNSRKYSDIYAVMKFMFNNDRCETAYTSDKEYLIKAFAYTLIFIEEYKPIGLIPSPSDEIDCLFKSIIYFRKKGYKLTIKNGTLAFNNVVKVATQIDKNLQQLGLLGILNLINLLPQWENSNIYKFADASPNILTPVGYIFNKALKHLHQTNIPKYKADKLIRDTFELSQHYISLYNIQKYGFSHFSYIYSNAEGFIELLGKQVICDHVFKIEQYDPASLFAFITFVKNQYDYAEIDYLYEIAQYVLECKINTPVPVNIKISDLEKKYCEILKIDMQSLLIHEQVNKDFNIISDFSKVNYTTKPFIRVNNKNIIFLNHSFFYVGFYYALFEILYQKGKSKDQGLLIEHFAESQLNNANENLILGEKKYKVSKDMRNRLDITSQELESDMVMYNDQNIVFFEVKLRQLSKQSKSGNGYFLLNDLTESLIRSQTQLNKHMRYLQENGHIQFKSKEVLNYENKRIFKFSVSALDYQGISSRLLYWNFLKLIPTFTLATNNRYQQNVDSINKYFKEFSEEIQKVKNSDESIDFRAFFDTGYISVFQLIFLIHRSKQNKLGLINTMIKNICTFSDQTDFYYHYKMFD